MVDDNLIKPVANNQSVVGLTPAKDREEKKKRQNFSRQEKQSVPIQDEIIELNGEKIKSEVRDNGKDKHSIDYCA